MRILFLFFFIQAAFAEITEFPLPVYFSNKNVGDILSKIENNEKLINLSAEDSIRVLGDYVDPSVKDKWSEQRWITVKDFKDQGILVTFDVNNLAIFCEIRPKSKRKRVWELESLEIPRYEDALPSSDFSAFLTPHLFNTIQSDSENNSQFSADFDSAIQIKQWVLEGRFFFEEDERNQWRRGDTRIVRDFVGSQNRLSMGDLDFNTAGFLSFSQTAGIQLSKDYSLSPYLISQPINNREFLLKERSKIRLFINGQLIRVLELRSGRHLLKNLPLNEGINEVKLEIEGVSGRRDTLIFPASTSNELLRKGFHRYSYAAGVPYSEGEDNYRIYGNDEIAGNISFFHFYGLTSNLTIGPYAEWDKQQYLSGGQVDWASPLGQLTFDVAGSKVRKGSGGMAGRLFYAFSDFEGPYFTNRTWRVGTTYQSPSFAQKGILEPDNNQRWFFETSIGQNFGRDTSITLSTDYGLNEGDVNPWGVSAVWGDRWGQGLLTNLQFSQRKNFLGETSQEVILFFNYTFDNPRYTLNGSYISSVEEKTLGFSRNSERGDHEWDGTFDFRENPDQKEINGNLQYRHQKFNFGARPSLVKRNDVGAETKEIIFDAQSTIGFVGTNFFVSKPILNSFAMVRMEDPDEERPILVNDNGNSNDGDLSKNGYIVLPNLTPYRYYDVSLNDTLWDGERKLATERFRVIPTYKAGVAIDVKYDESKAIKGILLDQKGKPISLKYAIVSKSGKNWQIFTGRTGNFFLEDIEPGQYKVLLEGKTTLIGKLIVPKSDSSFIQVRPVKMRKL